MFFSLAFLAFSEEEGDLDSWTLIYPLSFLRSFLSPSGCPSLSRYDAMSKRFQFRLSGCFLDERGIVDGLLLRGIYRFPALSDD